jgi:type I restriction enzyme R subunit
MAFAIYQAMAKDERRPGLYREFPRDFFDLIVVDECHRGSAGDDSNWREILEYFEPAYQVGMTATPKRQDNIDTYRYFGNPIYTYSLRQGIDDGFLAPYRVHRIVLASFGLIMACWTVSKASGEKFLTSVSP